MPSQARLFTILLLFPLLSALAGGCSKDPLPGSLSSGSSGIPSAAKGMDNFYPPVSKEIKEVFQDVPRFGAHEVYQEYDGLKVAQFVVYSSGIVERLNFDSFTFLALWVFDPTRKNVVQYPLVLALINQDQQCIPFYQPAYETPQEWQDCEIYSLAIQPWIKRGKLLFPALAGDFVYPDKIDWDRCQGDFCALAKVLSQAYQPYAVDRQILQRSLNRVPKGWVLSWPWGSSEEVLTKLEIQEVAQ